MNVFGLKRSLMLKNADYCKRKEDRCMCPTLSKDLKSLIPLTDRKSPGKMICRKLEIRSSRASPPPFHRNYKRLQILVYLQTWVILNLELNLCTSFSQSYFDLNEVMYQSNLYQFTLYKCFLFNHLMNCLTVF